MMFTDEKFIAHEVESRRQWLIRQLRQVEKSGTIDNSAAEILELNDLIYMGGPRPEIGNPYNCWHLTNGGRALLPL